MRFLLSLVLFFSFSSIALSDTPRQLRVAISDFSPFVILSEGQAPRGFSIDLWHLLAEQAQLEFEFKIYEGVQTKLDALANGEVDLAIGGISQTAKREKTFDFSHPSYYSGLDILLLEQTQVSLFSVLKSVFAGGSQFLFKGLLLSVVILIIVSGHIIWFAEKGKDSFSDNYFQGVGQGIYWVIVTASTVGYGDFSPAKPFGRFVTIIIIIFSLPLFGIFISELSSSLTTMKLHGHVQSPTDLFKQQVGVVINTTSEDSANKRHLQTQTYPNLVSAAQALKGHEIDAIIYDAPHLHYFVHHHPSAEGLRIVGNRFDYQILAFASLNQNPIMETINQALLSVKESGRYDELRKVWFSQ